MDNNNEENEKLTPEERELQKKLTETINDTTHKFMDKIYAPLSWCWPVTIVLLVVRHVFGHIGYYDLSIYAATIFLWAPLAIVVLATNFFITLFYAISLFAAWDKFMQNIVFYFKTGFNAGKEKKKNDDESL